MKRFVFGFGSRCASSPISRTTASVGMLQYQTTFGAARPSRLPLTTLLAIVAILLFPFLVALVCKRLS